MSLVMLIGVFEDFNKLKSDHLASNSNFILKMWANFKEKIMEMEYLIQDITEDLKGRVVDLLRIWRDELYICWGFWGISWENNGSVIMISYLEFMYKWEGSLLILVIGLSSGLVVENWFIFLDSHGFDPVVIDFMF